MEEPGFKASESIALMTMIPMSAVGQEENLWLILTFDEDCSIMNRKLMSHPAANGSELTPCHTETTGRIDRWGLHYHRTSLGLT